MFKIKDFTFDIYNHDHIDMPENMNKFMCEGYGQYRYDIYTIEDIHVIEDHFIFNKDTIKIVNKNGLEKRYLYIRGDTNPYAVCEEISKYHSIVYVKKSYIPWMRDDAMFSSLLSLERPMYQHNYYILHSAYMIYNNKAILFSAPSGTGKSTQSNLWVKYRNARVINGDKSLLSKDIDGFYANGWTTCGSSKICFNESYPLSCIIVLSQAKENSIETLDYKNAFKKVLSELTVNYHNSTYVNDVMNFIDDMLKNIKVYHLACNISENAVECLENQLKKDNLL